MNKNNIKKFNYRTLYFGVKLFFSHTNRDREDFGKKYIIGTIIAELYIK